MPAAALAPLLAVPGVQFFGLHKNDQGDDQGDGQGDGQQDGRAGDAPIPPGLPPNAERCAQVSRDRA